MTDSRMGSRLNQLMGVAASLLKKLALLFEGETVRMNIQLTAKLHKNKMQGP